MLSELQNIFRVSILEGATKTSASRIPGGRTSVSAGVRIHRTNTFASLVKVLQSAFPVVCRLVGEPRFNNAARAYVQAHPPRQPHLSAYGRRFAHFLRGFGPAKGLPYLSDLARLEWARNKAYFAMEATPLDARDLARMSTADVENVSLTLHPSVSLVASAFAIHTIWEAARPDRNDISDFDPTSQSDHVLVARPDWQVESHLVTRGDFTFVLALSAGSSLLQAYNAALATEPNFDLQSALTEHFRRGVFSAYRNPNQTETVT